jgi:DNA-binding NarL/FixJ family response regulator
MGDRITDKKGRLARVIEVQGGLGIVIRWDEGVVGFEYPSAEEFTLLSRASERLRVVVAEDNEGYLQKLVSVLRTEFDVVATATDGKSALQLIHLYKPDVAILDLGMPLINGIEITKELAKHPGSPAVVICSVETDPEIVEAARSAGALSYVFKTWIERDLNLAVKSVACAKPFVSPV